MVPSFWGNSQMPTHKGLKCCSLLWAQNFGVSGFWSCKGSSRRGGWDHQWVPFCRDPSVLPSVATFPGGWCLGEVCCRSEVGSSPFPPLSGERVPGPGLLCGCPSSSFLPSLRSRESWLVMVSWESFYLHFQPPYLAVFIWKSPLAGPGLVATCEETKEEKKRLMMAAFGGGGYSNSNRQRGKTKRWHFHAAVKRGGGILPLLLDNKGSC